MKLTIAIALGCLAATACTDEQNLGNRYALDAPRWVTTFGVGATTMTPDALAFAPSGDLYMMGEAKTTAGADLDFGGQTLHVDQTDPNGGVTWLAKLSGHDGSARWARLAIAPVAIAVDAQGDVIVTGTYRGWQDFDGQHLWSPSKADAYVAKYGPDGQLVWVSGLSANSGGDPFSLAVAPDGQIYLAGTFDGALNLPDRTVFSDPDDDNFVASFDASGTLLWGRQLPVAGRLLAGKDGSVFMVGTLDHSTTYAGHAVDLTRDPEHFVVSVSPTGDLAWRNSFGVVGEQADMPRVAIDEAGRIAASSPLGSQFNTSETLLDPHGAALWTAGSPDGTAHDRAIVASGGAVVTAGSPTARTVDLGDGPKVGTTYLAVRDTAGHLVESWVLGDPTLGGVAIGALAVAPDGSLGFAGFYDQPVDLGGTHLDDPVHNGPLMFGVLAPSN